MLEISHDNLVKCCVSWRKQGAVWIKKQLHNFFFVSQLVFLSYPVFYFPFSRQKQEKFCENSSLFIILVRRKINFEVE